jgi:hypothetical protein
MDAAPAPRLAMGALLRAGAGPATLPPPRHLTTSRARTTHPRPHGRAAACQPPPPAPTQRAAPSFRRPASPSTANPDPHQPSGTRLTTLTKSPRRWIQAQSPIGGLPGSVPGCLGWRSGRPSRARPGHADRLIVVAGVQAHHRPGGQRADHRDGAKVAASNPASRWLAGAGSAASGMPPASTATERFNPCLRRSTELGPATWPPQGALVVQPSTASCSSSKPSMRS